MTSYPQKINNNKDNGLLDLFILYSSGLNVQLQD